MAWPEVHDGVYHDPFTVDQSQSTGSAGITFRDTSNREKLAQTFKPAVTKNITAIELSIARSYSPQGYIWVEIFATSGGLPTGTALTFGVDNRVAKSAKITTSAISGDYSIVKFILPNGITLTSGTQYAIVLCGDYASGSDNCIAWQFGASTSYTDGSVCTYNGTNWSEMSDYDFVFTTYYGETNAFPLDQLPLGAGEAHTYGKTTISTGNCTTTSAAFVDAFGSVAASVGVCTVSIATPAVISRVAHGLAIGDAFNVTNTGALPTGMTAGTLYYVISAGFGVDSFRFSATLGGAAINTSGTQSGTHTLNKYPKFAVTLVTKATALVTFVGCCANTTTGHATYFDISVDDTRVGNTNEGFSRVLQYTGGTAYGINCSFSVLVTGLTAGSHTFKLTWGVTGGTGTILANSNYAPTLSVIAL